MTKNAIEKRWKATCFYQTDAGPIEVKYFVEEIEELHHLIEAEITCVSISIGALRTSQSSRP